MKCLDLMIEYTDRIGPIVFKNKKQLESGILMFWVPQPKLRIMILSTTIKKGEVFDTKDITLALMILFSKENHDL